MDAYYCSKLMKPPST